MWPFGRIAKAKDRRLAFLEALAGSNRAPAQAYRRLVADRNLALEEVQDAGDRPPNWQVEDAILVHVLSEHRLVDFIDWVEDIPILVEAVDARLRRAGKPPIGPEDREWIDRYVAHNKPERGDAVALAYGPLADSVETRGLRIVDLSSPSDCYRFTLVTPQFAEAWIGVSLSEAFRVEDPSWQFEAVLRGSRFEHFLRPRAVKA